MAFSGQVNGSIVVNDITGEPSWKYRGKDFPRPEYSLTEDGHVDAKELWAVSKLYMEVLRAKYPKTTMADGKWSKTSWSFNH